MRGRAHVYPRAHIGADDILPARYQTTDDEAELGRRALLGIDGEFANRGGLLPYVLRHTTGASSA